MALDIPDTAEEVIQRAKTDVRRSWTGSNPFLKNSLVGAIVTSYANRIFDLYLQLKEGIKQSIPDTATGEFLSRWAAIFGKTLLPATKSSGNVVATGIVGSNIPLGEVVVSTSGETYISLSSVDISSQSISVVTLTRSGQVATVTTLSDHRVASNVLVDITGADQSEYNLTGVEIIVIASNQFTYQVSGSPATPATGTILVGFDSASVPVESVEFQDSSSGINVNLDSGESTKLQSPVTGVDDSLVVDFGEVGGGTDQEKDNSLRLRTLDRIQNPVANFNTPAIRDAAFTVAGVTRVFVEEITPEVGQVTIYFMRDNDDNPIPSGSEVILVDDVIQAIRPANTAEIDVIVKAPTAVPTNFTFTDIQPNTTTMKNSVSDNLAQFFAEQTEVGINIDEDAYRSAIKTSIDSSTGELVSTFTLSTPSGDITINDGEIGTLGTVDFV